MPYEVPAAKASIKQNRFEFKVPGDRKTYTLPYQQYLTNGLKDPLIEGMKRVAPLIREGRQGDIDPGDAALIAQATKAIFEAHAPGVYELLDEEQTQDPIRAWTEESQTSLGK